MAWELGIRTTLPLGIWEVSFITVKHDPKAFQNGLTIRWNILNLLWTAVAVPLPMMCAEACGALQTNALPNHDRWFSTDVVLSDTAVSQSFFCLHQTFFVWSWNIDGRDSPMKFPCLIVYTNIQCIVFTLTYGSAFAFTYMASRRRYKTGWEESKAVVVFFF